MVHSTFHYILPISIVPWGDPWFSSLPAGAANRQPAGICFYSEAKNQHFCPKSAIHCIDLKKCGVANWHMCPLGQAKFHLRLVHGGGYEAPKWKISTFW